MSRGGGEFERALQSLEAREAIADDGRGEESPATIAKALARDLARAFPILDRCIRMDAAAWERVLTRAVREESAECRMLIDSLGDEYSLRLSDLIVAHAIDGDRAASGHHGAGPAHPSGRSPVESLSKIAARNARADVDAQLMDLPHEYQATAGICWTGEDVSHEPSVHLGREGGQL
jgi:hypothetical protein